MCVTRYAGSHAHCDSPRNGRERLRTNRVDQMGVGEFARSERPAPRDSLCVLSDPEARGSILEVEETMDTTKSFFEGCRGAVPGVKATIEALR